MADRSVETVSYAADILGGGFPMEAMRAPAQSDGPWRLVVVPGAPSKYLLFQRLLRLAPPELDVTVIMRPGYGGSSRQTRSPVLDFADQVAAFLPVLEASEGRRTIVMGVSYGGALALKCALDHPDFVDAVLTCAMLVDEPRRSARAAAWLGGAPGLERLLPDDVYSMRREVVGRRQQIGALFDRLNTLRQPVSIVQGDRDHLIPMASAEMLRGLLPQNGDVELRRIEGGTHYMECERPNTILSEIAALIDRAERVDA